MKSCCTDPAIKSLILVGGQSSRMGCSKHLLPRADTTSFHTESIPLLFWLIQQHSTATARSLNLESAPITISICNVKQKDEIEKLFKESNEFGAIQRHYVEDGKRQAGPASGLLAASESDPERHWLVTGCDYPLLERAALQQLINAHKSKQPAVTCFVNKHGYPEPLIAIWSPVALSHLRLTWENMQQQGVNIGPNMIIKALEKDDISTTPYKSGVLKLTPDHETWLFSVNTPDEWQSAQKQISSTVLPSSTS